MSYCSVPKAANGNKNEAGNRGEGMGTQIGILVDHVSKAFGKEQVLKDVCLEIPAGQIYGVVGNNGSGKTVLMKCICGFLHPDSGKIFVNEMQVGKECDFPDKLGVIIETPGFIPNISGYQNLKILAALKARIGKRDDGAGGTFACNEKAGGKVFAGDAPETWNCSGNYGKPECPDSG